METLCPSVQSNGEAASDQLTVGGILRLFLPVLLHLLKLSAHKLRVLWQLAACGTPALGANLFHCPHCQHRHWAPRSCGNRHCPRCLAAKSWQWLEKQTPHFSGVRGKTLLMSLRPDFCCSERSAFFAAQSAKKRTFVIGWPAFGDI